MATTKKPVRTDDETDDDETPAQTPAQADGGDDTDWKAEARKWERRAKESNREARENSEAARKLAELEEADKSETEKAQRKVADAEAKAAQAERRALIAEIGAEKGLTLAVAKRLQGDTREELEADADELLEAFGPKGAGKPADGVKPTEARRAPKEDLRPGASGDDADDGEVTKDEAAKIADRITKGSGF